MNDLLKTAIIEHYKSQGNYYKTWLKFSSKKLHISRKQVKDILTEAGFKIKLNADAKLVSDGSREFRFLTDDDIDFENEIKTALW